MVRAALAVALAASVLACAALLPTAAVPLSNEGPLSEAQLLASFAAFRAEFNRSYADESETALRFDAFAANMRAAAALNANSTAAFGMGPLSDRTDEEYARLLGYRPRRLLESPGRLSREDVPHRPAATTKVDWRTEGLVTRVKNQGQCGSCWTFGTTGVIEGAWAKAGHKLTSLSEAEFLDCDTVDGACDGGNQADALDFAIKNWGGNVEPALTYPYLPVKAPCLRIAKAVGATVKSWKEVDDNEDTIADAVAAYGPVTVGVDASHKDWQNYKSGVMCSLHHKLDHAVLIVGFDSAASPPYWIVKNSWGSSWGEDGYLRVEMGKDCFGIKKDVQAAFA